MLFFDPTLLDGALYEPSGEKETQMMIDLLDIKSGDKTADLGSGDGRVIIAMAKKGAYANGFEKDKNLVQESLKNIAKASFPGKASIHYVNFWKKNLSEYKKISVFQCNEIMERLEKKLQEELSPGSLVVSHHWTFPNWKPIKKRMDIYLYMR